MKQVILAGLCLAMIGCAAQPMKPEYLATLSGWELCVNDAAAKLYGDGVEFGGKRLASGAIESELAKRGVTCTPTDTFVTIAEARMGQQQQAATLQAQRNAALAQALQGVSQTIQNQQMIEAQQTQNAILQQAVNKPVTVNCQTYGSQTHCVGN